MFGNASWGREVEGTLPCNVAAISLHTTAVWLTGGRTGGILLLSYANGNIPAWLAVKGLPYCEAEHADNRTVSCDAAEMNALAFCFILKWKAKK